MNNPARNMTIGLIDGLTIPFALAVGMTAIIRSSSVILVSCLSIIIAYSLTMTIGAYLSAAKTESRNALSPALTIGVSYIAGGLLSVFPFYFIAQPSAALKYSAAVTMICLFIAGYLESRVNHVNPWAGAARVMLTGAVAGAAAYGVAGLFR